MDKLLSKWNFFKKLSPRTRLSPRGSKGLDTGKKEEEKNRYIYINHLGVGQSGTVDEYFDNVNKRYVAIKKIDNKIIDRMIIYHEPDIMHKLSGKHLSFPIIYENIYTENSLYIVMERIAGLDLIGYTNINYPLSKCEVKIIMKQLVVAMNIAHNRNIIHRDIKLDNIMIYNDDDNLIIKILDWGYGTIMDGYEDFKHSGRGSPEYVAPEIIRDNPIIGPFNDVWAIGVILYALVAGRLPFKRMNSADTLENILNINIDYKDPFLDKDTINLLKKIFVSYKDRITCKDIIKNGWLDNQQK